MTGGGELKCRRVTELPTTFPQNILDQFTKSCTINLGTLAIGEELGLKNKDDSWTVGDIYANVAKDRINVVCRLNGLVFTTRFETDGRIVTPTFGTPRESAGVTPGAVKFVWRADSAGIPLYFAIQNARHGLSLRPSSCYLFALNEGNAYRLPIPNIYEDCSVCMGDYSPSAHNLISNLQGNLDQFLNSNWNSDLIVSGKENLKSMFRFTPLAEGEGFHQEPSSAYWVDLCGSRVHHALIDEFVDLIKQSEGI